MNEKGEADLQEVTQAFNAYYRKRMKPVCRPKNVPVSLRRGTIPTEMWNDLF